MTLTSTQLILPVPPGAGGPAKLPPNRRPAGAPAAPAPVVRPAVPAQSSVSGPSAAVGNNSSLHRSLAAPPPPPPGLKPSSSTGQLPPSRSVPSSPQVTDGTAGRVWG